MPRTAVSVVLLIIGVGLAVVGQLAMKTSINKAGAIEREDFKHPGKLIMRVLKDPWAITGIVSYILFALVWLVVLSRVSLSVAYPMIAAGFVVIVLFSRFVFKEEVRPIAWLGLALIVVGVAITAQGLKANGRRNTERKHAPAVHAEALSEPKAPEIDKASKLSPHQPNPSAAQTAFSQNGSGKSSRGFSE